uniref:Cation/H+ exchanger domain-containing protein n=1 Tax=Kalanchoe fedtschenkoi TaxID=63787 RepID=A0A7N0TQH2_KALFE
MGATSNGFFQGENPLDFALPLVIVQICLVVLVTRGLGLLIKPLRQPRVIAEIIGGVLLGPSALGRNKTYLDTVFPTESLTVLDTLANIGLMFFLFLVGLELDVKSLCQTGKKSLGIALAGISFPFMLGIGSSFILRVTISKGVDAAAFLVFMGVALSITAFPVLARILAELKLLTTDVGKMAMSAAAINDVAAWVLLAFAIALSGTKRSPFVPLWIFLAGCAFLLVTILIGPPIFRWMIKQTTEGEPVKETYVCATLAAVLAAGFITDSIGIHAMFGAFVVGVVVPKEGTFASALVERLEDLISGLFLPLFFVSSGLKTNIATVQGLQSWGLLLLVIVTACCGKIVGTCGVAMLFKVPFRESLTLGLLMNTKGLVELIVLNIGKDRKVLNDETFAIMVLMALFTTLITVPLVTAVYKPAGKSGRADYKHRTVERKDSSSQLRILACFHSSRNIPSLINLIEASRGTEKPEGLRVYSMHLMELTERSSAILMVHKARKNGLPFWNKTSRSDSNHVVVAFDALQKLGRVSIRPMTSISSFTDMHEDICSTAETTATAIIILPFHKHQMLDGSLETTHSDFRWVNKRVLEHAPCSVGILVDRGLGRTVIVSSSSVAYAITVLFFGGPDDREALAYGARMAEHPGICLAVIRFSFEFENSSQEITRSNSNDYSNPIDDHVLADVKNKASTNDSITYAERSVRNTSETTCVINEFRGCNLILVGRNPEGEAASCLGITRSGTSELGPVGSLLTSPEFSTTATVLVVQQYSSQVLLETA